MKNEKALIIQFSEVSKRYYIRAHKSYILREVFKKMMLKREHKPEFWALRDLTFSIHEGESLAFVGSNGAGKSTLLGLVAGTLYPTTGVVRVRGRIGALLELGAGFHPDLSGRENVYLNASLLGMQKDEIEDLYLQIVEFAGLGEFIDAPLRTYSSGMRVRLGFSVAIHVDPDVLIMDEVLAVGDQQFQAKCMERIETFRDLGKTLLFVSHNPEAIRALCRRVIWIDAGRIVADGPAEQVIQEYHAAMLNR